MAPRNSDGNGPCKKNFPSDDRDINPQDIVPCLLHKKHKVVKLVKDQMQKIQQEGLLCPVSGEDEKEEVEILRIDNFGRLEDGSRSSQWKNMFKYVTLLFLLLLMVLLMVWISAGPLSNTIAHTPIPVSSFVRTEGICTLEKKYLQRWGKADYYE